MPTRWVLLHDCRITPEVDRREGGLPFRRINDDGRPFTCDCERRIATRDARYLVERGDAVWKLRWVGDHRPPVDDHSELILLKVKHSIHSRTISHRDIERAYVNEGKRGQHDRDRIAAYGEMKSHTFDPR